ncbi:etoposide-induced protein 2.4 homolog isoform X2 [Belonocnema kinseyi]|nr:etoposide-induced protein 2.4 homolog isoform X2 [Belonocnema kinseyi]XP_033230231.1 etoposide-induced protein 2.4 homolog isoform X2 [Belonocnema kinseyi]XP_033230232.1 etoposide-induced protein 2.4 homolog isoform X2 [Belonocnema kinseyi]
MCRGLSDSLKGAVVLYNLDKQINEKFKKTCLKSNSRRTTNPSNHSPSMNSKEPRESTILTRTMQCCGLNGGFFLGSILILENILFPCLKYLLTIVFGHSPGMGTSLWSWIKPFLTLTFGTFWILPLFVLSRVINSFWFQDIADSAYRFRQGRPHHLPSVSILVADMLVSVLVQVLFLAQGMIVSNIPLPMVGDVLALIHMCLLYSLYSFEYKWFNMGWELHRRLTFIEGNWPYFIGFGLPLALLTNYFDSIMMSGCVFSILFPLFIISGNEAEPVTGVCDYPLKLFSPVIAIANTLFTKTMGPARRP